jgi:hypothetical protein
MLRVRAVQDRVKKRTVRPDELARDLRDGSGTDVKLASGPVERDGHAHIPEQVEHLDGVTGSEHQKTS